MTDLHEPEDFDFRGSCFCTIAREGSARPTRRMLLQWPDNLLIPPGLKPRFQAGFIVPFINTESPVGNIPCVFGHNFIHPIIVEFVLGAARVQPDLTSDSGTELFASLVYFSTGFFVNATWTLRIPVMDWDDGPWILPVVSDLPPGVMGDVTLSVLPYWKDTDDINTAIINAGDPRVWDDCPDPWPDTPPA